MSFQVVVAMRHNMPLNPTRSGCLPQAPLF
jgi:hypothetical protein